MRIKVNKLFLGKVSVRDYLLEKALNENRPLVIEHDGDTMTMQPDEIHGNIVGQSDLMKSKFESKSYRLIDFEWKADDLQLKMEV